jgi:hypothetical protein
LEIDLGRTCPKERAPQTKSEHREAKEGLPTKVSRSPTKVRERLQTNERSRKNKTGLERKRGLKRKKSREKRKKDFD